MDLPSRSEPCKKNEIKTFSLVFQFFLATVQTGSRTHYALSSGEYDGTIYIKIIVEMSAGDATTPVAYEDHSSNGQIR
jgi:hypothetical protein